MNPIARVLTASRWSPYIAGTGIGMLSWLTFGLMGKGLGTSTTFVTVAGATECLVGGAGAQERLEGNSYFSKLIFGAPIIEWQFALVVMLFVGAFVAAKLAGSRFVEHVPDLWKWRFGPSRTKRYVAAFLGGAILLFGARMAGGCTSGHAITGGLQLAIASWSFLMAMFASGLAAAFIIYGKAGRSHV